jgi:CBS-domain-containing membrane protein
VGANDTAVFIMPGLSLEPAMHVFSPVYRLLISKRWRASFGVLLGMGLCSLFLHALTPASHWMLVPVGATLVILYIQPHSPVAQPQIGATLAVALSIWLMAIASLVAQMTDNGLPHVPVIDATRRVVGIVTQSDMLAALYKRIAVSEALATPSAVPR